MSDANVAGRPSGTARAALVTGVLANVAPLVGWGAFAISARADSIPDAMVWGSAVALIFGAVAVVAALAAVVLAIVELRAAPRAIPPRSRFAAAVALSLGLAAPLIWALEWAIVVFVFLAGAPTHVL